MYWSFYKIILNIYFNYIRKDILRTQKHITALTVELDVKHALQKLRLINTLLYNVVDVQNARQAIV